MHCTHTQKQCMYTYTQHVCDTYLSIFLDMMRLALALASRINCVRGTGGGRIAFLMAAQYLYNGNPLSRG